MNKQQIEAISQLQRQTGGCQKKQECRMREINEGKQKVQTSSYKINESWDEIYSMGNIVNNNVISLYGDRW